LLRPYDWHARVGGSTTSNCIPSWYLRASSHTHSKSNGNHSLTCAKIFLCFQDALLFDLVQFSSYCLVKEVSLASPMDCIIACSVVFPQYTIWSLIYLPETFIRIFYMIWSSSSRFGSMENNYPVAAIINTVRRLTRYIYGTVSSSEAVCPDRSLNASRCVSVIFALYTMFIILLVQICIWNIM
jgi:hypothetical protein